MLAKHHLKGVGHVIRMADKKLHRQILYGLLRQGKRPLGDQKERSKDHCNNILKDWHRQPSALETLASDRVRWRNVVQDGGITIDSKLSNKSAENRTQRFQQAAGAPVAGPQFSCQTCGKICGSRIGLHSHARWHRHQRH